MSQTRRIEDEVKDGDVVTDGQGNEFIVVKRINRVQGSIADQQALIKSMRRLATVFKLFAGAFVLGLAARLVLALMGQNSPALPDGFSLILYAASTYAFGVVLEFLANLGERIEGIYKHLAKQANRAAVNQLLKD